MNGYSPIRPAGVAREFRCGIHGEVDLGTASWFLDREAGGGGELERLGVDGIIIANELGLAPQPSTDWELAITTPEGRVFHRREAALDRVRSVTEIDSRPGESFAPAEVTQIVDQRNQLQADISVPPNGPPALLMISRPYFSGYSAKIGTSPLKVETYRRLIPTVQVPPGLSGRLILTYRPWWLLLGATIAFVSLVLMIGSVLFAIRNKN